nr:hypothetical protein [Tanacetum cinerariifolium]
ASTSLGGDSTVEAAYTIYKASQDAHASSDIGHDAAEVPDDTTMPFRRTSTTRRRLRNPFTSSASEHVLENIFAVEDTLPAEDLAKKLHAEQEAEFTRQQEELAHQAQAESVVSPAAQGTGLSDQHRRELDAAQLIYTEADWLELMAKIATNSALSKQLLGDDVNEENMNEWLGMLLMRKRQELAEQSRVKPMHKTRQRDYMRDFVKIRVLPFIIKTLERSNLLNFKRTTFRPTPSLEAPSAKRARQGVPQYVHAASSQVLAVPSVDAAVSVPTAPSIAADVSVPAVSPNPAAGSAHVDTE